MVVEVQVAEGLRRRRRLLLPDRQSEVQGGEEREEKGWQVVGLIDLLRHLEEIRVPPVSEHAGGAVRAGTLALLAVSVSVER